MNAARISLERLAAVLLFPIVLTLTPSLAQTQSARVPTDKHPYLLLTILLVLLAIFDQVRIHFRRSDSNPVHHYPFLTPPLRAPPQS